MIITQTLPSQIINPGLEFALDLRISATGGGETRTPLNLTPYEFWCEGKGVTDEESRPGIQDSTIVTLAVTKAVQGGSTLGRLTLSLTREQTEALSNRDGSLIFYDLVGRNGAADFVFAQGVLRIQSTASRGFQS